MRILLVGEYSRLHNTLKEGLLQLGHDVILVGTKDGFKDFPVDNNYDAKFFSLSLFRPFIKLIYKITGYNLIEIEHAIRAYFVVRNLKDFDVVQLINESSFESHPSLETWLLKKLIKNNRSIFLMSCGIDHMSIKYANDKKLRYSILSPLEEDNTLKNHYQFVLKRLDKAHTKLHHFLYNNIKGVIASDLDYHLPLKGHPKYLGIIPNPINVNKIEATPFEIDSTIKIFHGINRRNYIKKGNRYFEQALEQIKNKYGQKIEITTTENLPYNQYIKALSNSHIVLDQVYAYDQGFNALEAMAMGKVVFTGAEKEWLEHYNLEEDTVAINAMPDVQNIVNKLEWLILNPEKISQISNNAIRFIKDHHDHISSTKKYLKFWQNAIAESQ